MNRELVDLLLDSQSLLKGLWESHQDGTISGAEMLELALTLGRSQYVGQIKRGVTYRVGEVEFEKESDAKAAASFAAAMGLEVGLDIRPKASVEELETAWLSSVPRPHIGAEHKRRGRTAGGASEPGAPLKAVEEALASLGIQTLDDAGTFETAAGTDGNETFVSGQCFYTAQIQEYCRANYGVRFKGSMPAAVWRILAR